MSSPCFPCPVRKKHVTSNQKSSASPMHPPNSPPPSQILVRDVYFEMVVRSLYPSRISRCYLCGPRFVFLYIPPGVDSPRGSGEKITKIPPGIVDFPPGGTISAKKKIPSPGGKPRLLRYCGNRQTVDALGCDCVPAQTKSESAKKEHSL